MEKQIEKKIKIKSKIKKKLSPPFVNLTLLFRTPQN